MTLESKIALRLQFLVRVVRKECRHLTAAANKMIAEIERRGWV